MPKSSDVATGDLELNGEWNWEGSLLPESGRSKGAWIWTEFISEIKRVVAAAALYLCRLLWVAFPFE